MSDVMDEVVSSIKNEISLDKIEEPKYFHQIENIGKKNHVYVVLSKLKNLVPFFVCTKGMQEIGIKGNPSKKFLGWGMEFFNRLMHPDNVHIVTTGMNHFFESPHEDFVMAYHIKTVRGWKWAYGASRTLTMDGNNAGYIITIVRMVEDVLKNQCPFDSEEFNSNSSADQTKYDLLSRREKEILNSIALGKTNQDIGTDMNISIHTVKSHRKNIMKKLDINSTAKLIRFALLSGSDSSN